MRFIERDWLSANMIIFDDIVMDTGHQTHCEMTLQLVAHALPTQGPRRIINTHLHSDHCGGNAILQRHYPNVHTSIPSGAAQGIKNWNADKLSFETTGQDGEPFRVDGTFKGGDEIELAGLRWRAIETAGHDFAMLCLYCESEAILISADALWENGFGVLFAQFSGHDSPSLQAGTLARLSELEVRCVIPGHGNMFTDFRAALAKAAQRVEYFAQDPDRIWRNGLRALLKFRLLAEQQMDETRIAAVLAEAPITRQMLERVGASSNQGVNELAVLAADDLVRSKAAVWKTLAGVRMLLNE
jgi:glyoxylase-like metal-dependent hydrolase (beta-lactamase superfamily II)